MSKNFLNKKQKRILYKNMGILFALTVLCAVFARRFTGANGETLQDLADRQKQQLDAASSADSPAAGEQEISEQDSVSAPDSLPAGDSEASEQDSASDSLPVKEPETMEEASASSEDPSSQKQETENEEVSPAENNEKTTQPEGEPAMDDRILYQDGFYYESLNDTVKNRITGISYPADDSSAAVSYDTLRYVKVLYRDFNGETQTGELICHKAIAQDLVEIFYELYEAQYPIEKITLVDDYQGDDESSMQDNNTSCFNYRSLPSGRLSNHAYGLAVDLNPFYNPYVTHKKDGSVNIAPAGSEHYADREQSFDYKINQEDLAYTLFIQHGFTWGGSWRSSKDYQHFEKAI